MYNKYDGFKGISNYNDVQIMTDLENNLKMWLDWSFLSIGAWTNVTGYSGQYYGAPSKLNWVSDSGSYQNGRVWQAARKDWVWESGATYNGTHPINITGVVVNGIGYSPTGNGNTPPSYYINYPLGRVVFTGTPISTGANVTIDYSYRNVQVYKADDAPWWKELQYDTFDSNNPQFKQDPQTGDWSIGSHQRIQLPAIIMETVSRGTSRGHEIGNGSLEVSQDVLFHVIADNRRTRNDLTSILFLQNDKYIWLFDSNRVNSTQSFPLNARGQRVNGLSYADLVSETGFRARECRLNKTTMSEVDSLNSNLYEGVVRSTLEVIFDHI